MTTMVLGACRPPAEPEARVSPPLLATDSTEYSLEIADGMHQAFALVTVTNSTGAPLHLARCRRDGPAPVTAVVRSGRDARRPSVVGLPSPCEPRAGETTVAAGRALTFPVWIGSLPDAARGAPVPPEQRIGEFHVRVPLCTVPLQGAACPAGRAVEPDRTNDFVVRYPPE